MTDAVLAELGEITEKTAQTLFRQVAEAAPQRSGQSARLLRLEVGPDNTWRIMAPRSLVWTITGTRPHLIRPVRAQALRWEDLAGTHFAKLVRHPGTRPQPWLREALRYVPWRELFRHIAQEVKAHVVRILRRETGA